MSNRTILYSSNAHAYQYSLILMNETVPLLNVEEYAYIKYWKICVKYQDTHIHHKSRIFCLYWHFHGCLAKGRNFPGIWSCRLEEDKWFPGTASPGPHSPRGTGNWTPGGTLRTQIVEGDPCTVHEYHLKTKRQKIDKWLPLLCLKGTVWYSI